MNKFKSFSDFIINATEEEKKEVYKEVLEKSIAAQNDIVESSKNEDETDD